MEVDLRDQETLPGSARAPVAWSGSQAGSRVRQQTGSGR